MSTESRPLAEATLAREFPNVGPGRDPASLGEFLDTNDFTVVLLQRDYHCRQCRGQVQAVAERYSEFLARSAQVISVLPESRERAADWQDSYDLPYPLLADPDTDAGEAFDQPVRFGPLGALSDLLGRMPEALVIDGRGDPAVVWTHEGSNPTDRPDVDELLGVLDDLADD